MSNKLCITYIDNYGNKDVIVELLKEVGITCNNDRKSGFLGCDPPRYMDLDTSDIELVKKTLQGKTKDSWGVK